LQRDALQAFEFAHNREDWVHPLADALAGVTAQEALWRPGPNLKGIWDIVLHMAAWTENCVQRIQSGKHSKPAEGAWPPLPSAPDEAAWAAAQRRLWDALTALRAQIEATPSVALLDCTVGNGHQSWSPLVEVLSRLIHNAYHIGQITKLRECRAARP
jgi:hypothetical protein